MTLFSAKPITSPTERGKSRDEKTHLVSKRFNEMPGTFRVAVRLQARIVQRRAKRMRQLAKCKTLGGFPRKTGTRDACVCEVKIPLCSTCPGGPAITCETDQAQHQASPLGQTQMGLDTGSRFSSASSFLDAGTTSGLSSSSSSSCMSDA